MEDNNNSNIGNFNTTSNTSDNDSNNNIDS